MGIGIINSEDFMINDYSDIIPDVKDKFILEKFDKIILDFNKESEGIPLMNHFFNLKYYKNKDISDIEQYLDNDDIFVELFGIIYKTHYGTMITNTYINDFIGFLNENTLDYSTNSVFFIDYNRSLKHAFENLFDFDISGVLPNGLDFQWKDISNQFPAIDFNATLRQANAEIFYQYNTTQPFLPWEKYNNDLSSGILKIETKQATNLTFDINKENVERSVSNITFEIKEPIQIEEDFEFKLNMIKIWPQIEEYDASLNLVNDLSNGWLIGVSDSRDTSNAVIYLFRYSDTYQFNEERGDREIVVKDTFDIAVKSTSDTIVFTDIYFTNDKKVVIVYYDHTVSEILHKRYVIFEKRYIDYYEKLEFAGNMVWEEDET